MKGQWPLKLEGTLSPSSSVSLHPRHNNNFDLNTANTSRDKAMALIKIMLLIATTMALSITLMTVNRVGREEEQKPLFASEMHPLYGDTNLLLPSKRVSRFLAETKKPRAAANCKKDNDICAYLTESNMNSTCCNNQCMDLSEDKHNCGACKKKCKYTETCCRGGCVNTNFDKRHCGGCNKACAKGQYCVYGLCNYA